MRNFTIQEISIILNFVFLFIICTLLILRFYHDNFHRVGNITKDIALKVLNKINQGKLLATSQEELANVICKKLHEDLHARFTIALSENNKKISYHGDKQLALEHAKRIDAAFSKMVPQSVYDRNKAVYLQPLTTAEKNIGILLAESSFHDNIVYNLEKILPVLSDQISINLNNLMIKNLLDESKANAERERLRSLILSSISHDLKTPLFSIIGSLNIFTKLSSQNKLTKKNQKTLIVTALNEAERLNEFISDVLEMTRIESGAIKIHKQFISPSLVIEKTLQRFQTKLRYYHVHNDLNKNIKINFDPISIEQVMQNLIENTIKYSAKNTNISIYDEVEENNYKLFIKDEGIGIATEKLELIFNKFERFAMQDKISGSGLGLSIVKSLMEINNAKISATSAQDQKGTIFILEFSEFKQST